MSERITLGGRSFTIIEPLSPSTIRELAQIVWEPEPATDSGRLDQFVRITQIAIPSITDEQVDEATLAEVVHLRDVAFRLAGFVRLH